MLSGPQLIGNFMISRRVGSIFSCEKEFRLGARPPSAAAWSRPWPPAPRGTSPVAPLPATRTISGSPSDYSEGVGGGKKYEQSLGRVRRDSGPLSATGAYGRHPVPLSKDGGPCPLRPTIPATQTLSCSPLDWPRGVGGINKYSQSLGCVVAPLRHRPYCTKRCFKTGLTASARSPTIFLWASGHFSSAMSTISAGFNPAALPHS